jgi:hypothetical protein
MWKTIKDFERYEINENGDIKNIKTTYLLKSIKDKDGYLQIGLRKEGIRKKYFFKIHKLVALHFLEFEELKQIDHIDRNKLNNNFTNLRWVTFQENIDNRKNTCWTTNLIKELYITKYPNGFMIRINKHNLKYRSWHKTLEDAILKRDELVECAQKKFLA